MHFRRCAGGKKEMVITSIFTYLVLFWRAFLGVEGGIIWVLLLSVQAKGPQVVAQTVVMGPGWSVEGTATVMTHHRKAFGMLPCSRLSGCGQTGGTGADAVFFPSPRSDDERSQLLPFTAPRGTGLLVPARGFVAARLRRGVAHLPLLSSPSGSWWSWYTALVLVIGDVWSGVAFTPVGERIAHRMLFLELAFWDSLLKPRFYKCFDML